jgi:hypothetical protein
MVFQLTAHNCLGNAASDFTLKELTALGCDDHVSAYHDCCFLLLKTYLKFAGMASMLRGCSWQGICARKIIQPSHPLYRHQRVIPRRRNRIIFIVTPSAQDEGCWNACIFIVCCIEIIWVPGGGTCYSLCV